jgi:ferric-dicitrate binding protein FerR (iron transport regulator)
MPRYARLAAQVLARADRSSAAVAPEPDVRARAIEAMAGAITARARAKRLRTGASALALVAAAAAVAVVGLRLSPNAHTPVVAEPAQIVAYSVSGGPSVVVSGSPSPLAGGQRLPVGSRLMTPADGRAVLSFSTGTSVIVEGGADLTVADEGLSQVLRLDTGSIDVHVAKLAHDQRFLVETADAEVEVRGTRFRVAIAPAGSVCAGRTMVDVSEGVVTVQHGGAQARLAAGASWPEECARTVDVASLPRAAATTTPAPTGTPAAAAAAASTFASTSTLRDQNDLFARAFVARRRGDNDGALATLDHFLAVYPRSPLLESVVVERVRVLRASSPSRAASAARDYLARYPDGFARAEAEAIVAGAP